MIKKTLPLILTAMVIIPLIITGCKAKSAETYNAQEAVAPTDEMMASTEPAQTVGVETIPPTAAPPSAPAPVKQVQQDRNKEIQKALKAAGLYEGAIDGKIGQKTKKAIEEFQKSKGLKVDGKVGPKTWAEMEKYLIS